MRLWIFEEPCHGAFTIDSQATLAFALALTLTLVLFWADR